MSVMKKMFLDEIEPEVRTFFESKYDEQKRFYALLCYACSDNLRGRYHYQLFEGYSAPKCLCEPCREKAKEFEKAIVLLDSHTSQEGKVY